MNKIIFILLIVFAIIYSQNGFKFVYNEDSFEVYTKIIKDNEGNDIQVFIKEDKVHNNRRDSTFYHDGSWEVFEMKGETEISLRNSLGITNSSIWDSEGKLMETTIKDKDDNFIVNDRYVWKNGLLIQMKSLDGIRNYYYGKNPYEDTVRVIPSDKGYNFQRSYDGSVGIIPKKGDANYKNYLKYPYGSWFNFEEALFKKESSEINHKNPESPKNTNLKQGERCDE